MESPEEKIRIKMKEKSRDKSNQQVACGTMLNELMSGTNTCTSKSRRHLLHRTDFELFVIILIAALELSVKPSICQYEVPSLQQQHINYMQQQTALPNKPSFKLSSSTVTFPSIMTPSVAPNPTSLSSTSPVSAMVQAINAGSQSAGKNDASVSLMSFPEPAQNNRVRQHGRILDYTQGATLANSQQFQPIIPQWPARRQAITQPQSQVHQDPQPQHQANQYQQSLQARVYNYLEPVTQQKERQQLSQLHQAAADALNNVERVSLQKRVLLIDGRSTAPVKEPQQTTTTTGVPPRTTSRQDSSGSNGNNSSSSSSSSKGSVSASCDSMRSNPKSLKTLLRNAKNLLTGGLASIEQRAGGLLWFGSNVLATLVPVASLIGLAPSFGSAASVIQSTPADRTNHSSNFAEDSTGKRTGVSTALDSLINGAAIAGNSSGSAGGLQSRVEYVMGWLERSIEHLPSFPRLHPQECVKRSICEAHHDPNRYGAIGLMLRLLFPASNLNSTSEMDNMEYKVINKYRHAAGYGLNKRLDNNGTVSGPVCKDKYEDCLVSLLEVGQNLVDFFLTK